MSNSYFDKIISYTLNNILNIFDITIIMKILLSKEVKVLNW